MRDCICKRNQFGARANEIDTNLKIQNPTVYSASIHYQTNESQSLNCVACPLETQVDCMEEGQMLKFLRIKEDWWRVTHEYAMLHPCLAGHCIGNMNYTLHSPPTSADSAWFEDPDSLCAPGHTGPFCAVCRPDYFMELGRCVPCRGTSDDADLNASLPVEPAEGGL